MRRVAAVCLLLLLLAEPVVLGTDTQTHKTLNDYARGQWFPEVLEPYRPVEIPPANLSNSPRLRELIRNGQLYLSLSDAIVLALENNLDIAVARYEKMAAPLDVMRSLSGSSPRGIPGAVIPTGLFGGALGGGIGAGAGVQGVGGAGGEGGGGVRGTSIGSGNTFDPEINVNYSFNRSTSPLNNVVLTGVPSLTTNTNNNTYFFSQFFPTGTTYFVGLTGARQSSTSPNVLFNPSNVSTLSLGFNQHLLNGYGYRSNARFIRVAKNNLKISDSVFRQSVQETVSRVINLYYDLVLAQERTRVARESVEVARKLLEDNKTQVEIGTLAPLEVTRAEAQLATNQEALIVAETRLQLQEELIKEVLARQLDPEIEAVRVVPTDKLPEPTPGDIQDELKAIEAALEGRPELEQGQLNLVNHDIAIGFTKNALLPTLDLFGLFSGAGLGGNRQIRAAGPGTPIIGEAEGGLTDALRRTFQFDFPTYAFGFSLQIPFRNRSAKADHARAVLDKRQAELRLQRLRSQIIQQVHNALVTLKQSRARMETSRKATQLAQQIFEAEQLRFQAGVSTPFLVIQAQRDLIAAQGSEQEAFNGYGKALVQLEMATGRLLERVGIDLEEAESGTVRTAPHFGR